MVKGTAKQSTNYGNNSYPASNAWSNGPKFTHTNSGVGQWWEVGFDNEYYIGKVRILNRRDCCGERLAGTKVMVGDQLCGTVQGGTKNGQWYDVTCSKPMKGRSVRLVTTQSTFLSISGFEAYSGSAGSSTTESTTGGSTSGETITEEGSETTTGGSTDTDRQVCVDNVLYLKRDGCVNGHNIKKLNGVSTVQECANRCNAHGAACVGIEYFDASKKGRSSYKVGSCIIASGTNIKGCDIKKYNMWLWEKMGSCN
jgi:hypothetical protein